MIAETESGRGVTAPLKGIDMFRALIIPKFDALGIVFVVAAGNLGQIGDTLAFSSPQKFGGPLSSLIIVGGTYSNGSLWEDTTGEGSVTGGITVSALASSVITAAYDSTTGTITRNGTSFAAPAVAALAAYYMTFPNLYNQFVGSPVNGVGFNVKQYLVISAHARYPGGPIVAYNQAAQEAFCTLPVKRRSDLIDLEILEPTLSSNESIAKRDDGTLPPFSTQMIMVSGTVVGSYSWVSQINPSIRLIREAE